MRTWRGKLPRTEVVFYREDDGTVPIRDWLDKQPPKIRDKCLARLARLEETGHELRRPEADHLRDGIYELRATYRSVQYRILYFFSSKDVVVVSHVLHKERQVPPLEIERAIERKKKFQANPTGHTFDPDEKEDGEEKA